MTFADDLMDEQEQEEQSPYPVAFGVTFTPPVLGGILGVLGVAGAAAIGWYLIKPQWDNLQAINAQVDEKELQRVQLEQSQQQIAQLQADLQEAQANQQQVLSLFAGEASFDTFLYTLSQRFNNRGQLLKYTPPTEEAVVVTDSSWGSDVNELLKTQTLSLQMEASFEQTMAILRDIERLQTLAALKNIKSEVTTPEQRLVNTQGTVSTAGEALLTTSFDLELLFPVSADELMESAAAVEAAAAADPNDPNATTDPNAAPPAQ